MLKRKEEIILKRITRTDKAQYMQDYLDKHNQLEEEISNYSFNTRQPIATIKQASCVYKTNTDWLLYLKVHVKRQHATKYYAVYANLLEGIFILESTNQYLTLNNSNLDNAIPNPSILSLVETDEVKGMYSTMTKYCVRVLKEQSMGTNVKDHSGEALLKFLTDEHALEFVYRYFGPETVATFWDKTPTRLTDKIHGKHNMTEILHGVHKGVYKLIREYAQSEDTVALANNLWERLLYAQPTEVRSVNSYIDIKSIFTWCQEIDDQRGYSEAQMYASQLASDIYECHYYWNQEDVKLVWDKEYLNHKSLVKYLYGSCYHQQGMDTPQEAMVVLKDYLQLVEYFPTFVKHPRYLKVAHDVASRNLSIVGNTDLDRGIQDVYQRKAKAYEGYFNVNGLSYTTVMPYKAKDLVDEGNQQSNCVGGYARSVAEHNTVIVFLRSSDTPEKSWVTFEVQNDEVVQAYGPNNQQLNTEQATALGAWMKVHKITSERYKTVIPEVRTPKFIFTMTHKAEPIFATNPIEVTKTKI